MGGEADVAHAVERSRLLGVFGENLRRVRATGDFGRRLREVRGELGVTQKQLADVAEMQSATLSRMEQGATDPHLSTVLRLARSLNVPPRRLVEDAPPVELPGAALRASELNIFCEHRREQLRVMGADLTDAEDFYYFAAERVAHREPIASAGVPEPRHLTMLRLRLLDGLTLREVGQRTGVSGGAVAQLLRHYFAIEGTPPAAMARRAATR